MTFNFSNFWTRLNNWEFWPWQVIYFPVFLYGIWMAIRSRSPFFFSTVNPGIEGGGMMIESKYSILKQFNPELIPKTLYMTSPGNFEELVEKMQKLDLRFPVIAKPDFGERGFMVRKMDEPEMLQNYYQQAKVNFLVQEYIDFPLEAGVFYHRIPGQSSGKITSVVVKDFLKVIGNGRETIGELLLESRRNRLYYNDFKKEYPQLIQKVPANGETVELMPIGNHCKGTTFLDGQQFITPDLNRLFDRISRQVEGFYYGRFDIRFSNWAELYQGKNFKILELNGAKSEPGHIYHPGNSLFKGYRDLFAHWNTLFKISRLNHEAGIPYLSGSEGCQLWRQFRRHHRLKRLRSQV